MVATLGSELWDPVSVCTDMTFLHSSLSTRSAGGVNRQVTLEEVPCPLCGQYNETIAARQIDQIHQMDETTTWLLRHCSSCHHYYLSPRPDHTSIDCFYPSQYAFYNPNKLKVAIRGLLREAVSQLYLPAHKPEAFDYHPSSNVLLRWVGMLLLPFLSLKGLCGAASVYVTPRTYGVPIRPGMSFLEIGCGAGWDIHLTDPSLSIRALARAGVRCMAVEPSSVCWEALAADGITVYASVVDLVAARPGLFDVVRLNWSLEHVHNPLDLFKNLRKLCGSGTRVIMTIPNYDGLTYSFFPDCIEVPVHLQYFTPSSVRKLCEMSGFHIERLHTFCTPSLIACVIGLMEGKRPERVLMRERRRILAMMNEAHQQQRGDELFCVLAPVPSGQLA